MDILVGGVGDAFAVQHHGTHFLVRHEGFTLLVDCPDAFRRALRENAFPHHGRELHEGDIDAVFITHLHGDHINGLEMLLAYRAMVLKQPLPLWTTPDVAENLWERRLEVSLGQIWTGSETKKLSLSDFADLHVVPWDSPTRVGPFEITTRLTKHHIPTSALRLTAAGRVFAYSCDTAWDPALVEWLFDGADLVFHESTHGAAHTPVERLASLTEAQRARLRVVHYPDQLDPVDYPELVFAQESQVIQV